MLALYRRLVAELNKDTVNIVLQYVFGDMRRVLVDGNVQEYDDDNAAEDEQRYEGEICGAYVLSEEDLDCFLRHELY
jgi:hypothetical protein